MRRILVIGIGAGNPEHMTVQAIKALNRADVVFIPSKGEEKSGLAALRREICDRFIERPYRTVGYDVPKRDAPAPSYRRTVDDWHDAIAEIHGRLLTEELGANETGAFLVWGDPAVYDSTLRIIDRLKAEGKVAFDCEVIPGITSVQALAAIHQIPLNTIGGPIHITTGRMLRAGWPGDADSVVVMLDGGGSFRTVDPAGIDIYWGANLGLDSQAALSGPLAEMAGRIEDARAEARGKEGWVMDTYLLRRR